MSYSYFHNPFTYKISQFNICIYREKDKADSETYCNTNLI